jgi:hypothetical protein
MIIAQYRQGRTVPNDRLLGPFINSLLDGGEIILS